MGKRELVALLNLSSWFLVMVERLFLAVPWCCLLFVIVLFPDHTHILLFIIYQTNKCWYFNFFSTIKELCAVGAIMLLPPIRPNIKVAFH